MGLGALGGVGLVDLAALQIPKTNIWPQLVGGLALGVGFVVSGYCPGTAAVSTASGHIDGAVSLVGVMLGALVFAALYPALEGFYDSGAQGVQTLPDLLGLPWVAVALGVTAMALGTFLITERIERWPNGRDGKASPPPGPAFRWVASGLGLAALLGVATLLGPGGTTEAVQPPVRQASEVEPLALAERLAGHSDAAWVVDLRDHAACAKARVPSALCVPADDPDATFLATLPPTRPLVLYGAAGLDNLPAAASAFAGEVEVLRGGWAAFREQLLTAPVPPSQPTPESLAHFRRQRAVHGWLTGAKTQPPPSAAPRKVSRGARKGGGC